MSLQLLTVEIATPLPTRLAPGSDKCELTFASASTLHRFDVILRSPRKPANELFERLTGSRIFADVDPSFFAQNQTQQRLQHTSRPLPCAFPIFSTSIADEQPARHERLNALGELIREHVQRIQTRIAVSANLLQCDGSLRQTNLRDP